jgi:hypothetical protein
MLTEEGRGVIAGLAKIAAGKAGAKRGRMALTALILRACKYKRTVKTSPKYKSVERARRTELYLAR